MIYFKGFFKKRMIFYKKKSTTGGFRCGENIIRLIFRRKPRVVQEIKIRRGSVFTRDYIIHHSRRFVNIHFVRFFANFFVQKNKW